MELNLDDVTAHNARDILAAVPDALSMFMGHNVRAPHPFAELVAPSPMRTAAFAAGQLLAARRPGEPEAAVVGRGIRTLDFGNALAAGLQDAARRSFDAQAQHRGAVSEIEVSKIALPESVGALDLSAPWATVGEAAEFKTSAITLKDGETITLASAGRLVSVTREAIINDDLGLVQEAIAAMGVAAARYEARLIAAALEANGNLTDGSPVFSATFGNVSTTAFDAAGAGLAAAMAALRNMPAADGHALDAQASTLFVAPDLEFDALNLFGLFHGGALLINSTASGEFPAAGLRPLRVQVLPGLAAGRFYLAAHSSVARSIAVARLAGQSHPLAVEAVKTPINVDGALVRVRIDTGAAMVGRLGIVKGGA